MKMGRGPDTLAHGVRLPVTCSTMFSATFSTTAGLSLAATHRLADQWLPALPDLLYPRRGLVLLEVWMLEFRLELLLSILKP